MSQLTNEELGQLPYEMLIETISLPSFEKSYSSCNSIWNPAGPFHIVFRPKRATENKNKANKIDSKVENYLYEDRVLFKRGKPTLRFRCLGPEKASYVTN